MAVGFERRQASLIGAGDLPFARVTGAVPDLSSIGDIGRDMQLRARQEKAQADADQSAKQGITDTLKGQEAGASDGQTYVGKDIYGYREFQLPDGSPEFQRSYIDGFNQTQDGKFRKSMETRFNEISTRVTAGDLTSTQATQLMQTYVEGALENAPAYRRGAYYELGQQEIAQRSGLMTSQAAARDAQLVADDLVAVIKTNVDEAISLTAAGGDPVVIQTQINEGYDTLVRLKRMGPKEAEAAKKSIQQVIYGQGMSNMLQSALVKGQVTPDALDNWGKSVATGNSEVMLELAPRYQVGPGAKPGAARYASKDVIARLPESVRKEMAVNLTTMAADYKAMAAAYADERAYAAELGMLFGSGGRGMTLSPDKRDNADALMARGLVESRPFDTQEGMAKMLAHLAATKYAPKPLAATLFNMANSGDPTQMEKALATYRSMLQLKDRFGDSAGEALRSSLPNDVVELLDGLDTGTQLGFTVDDIAANMKKARGNPEYAPGALMSQYNLKVKNDAAGDGFWTDFRDKWAYDYGTMPDPQAKDAFANAYRQKMIMTGDPQQSFATAYDIVKSRYRKSEIMLDGIEVAGISLTNPTGYEIQTSGLLGMSRPGQEYEWLNGNASEAVMEAMTSGALVMPVDINRERMTPDELAALTGNQPSSVTSGGLWNYLANPSDAFNSNWLGKTAKLQRVPGGNPDAPSYMIRMTDGQGNDLGPLMVERNGQMHPLEINPHEDKARAEQNYGARRNLDAFEAGAIERLGTLDGKFMGQLPLEQSMGYDGTVPFGEYLDSVAPQLTKQYKLELQPVLDGLEAARKSYEDQTGEKVPRTKIDQTTLMQPRAAGFDVAAAAAATVDSVLPDGSGGTFLLRIAAQESNFGMAAGTYRLSGDKGMTQVNTGSGLKEVQRRIAQGSGRVWQAAQVLNQRLGLDLNNLTKDDLDRPIVAMAVARLYVEAVGRQVPQDLAGQAAWWKRHYNTHLGAGTAAQFVRSANKVPEDWRSRIIREG